MAQPTENIKTLQLNLGVFIATNNIRRNTASFRGNVNSKTGTVQQISSSILAAGSYTIDAITEVSALVLQTSGPLEATILAPGGTLTATINELFVIDFPFTSVVLNNTGQSGVSINVIQV